MSELKACPFCFSEYVIAVDAMSQSDLDHYKVCCNACLASGPWSDSIDKAVSMWNTHEETPSEDCKHIYNPADDGNYRCILCHKKRPPERMFSGQCRHGVPIGQKCEECRSEKSKRYLTALKNIVCHGANERDRKIAADAIQTDPFKNPGRSR